MSRSLCGSMGSYRRELTGQYVHAISLASPTTEGNCWPCSSPVVNALKTRVALNDLLVVVTPMLSALQAPLCVSVHVWAVRGRLPHISSCCSIATDSAMRGSDV